MRTGLMRPGRWAIAVGLLCSLVQAYRPPAQAQELSETVVVVADRAPVTVGGQMVAAVGKGRWFGVLGRADDAVEVQVRVGPELRRGWVRKRHVRGLADDEVDLAGEALEVARALNPKLDVAAARARLDALVRRAAEAAAGGRTARERVRLLGARLFEGEGFAPGEPNTIDAVLDERKGNCLGLSVLYLCAARRAGVPACLVTAPKHVLVQCREGQGSLYVETTKQGRIHDSLDYLRSHLGEQQMSEAGGIHLKPLSAAQAAGVLRKELGRAFRDAGNYGDSLRWYARAVEINPRHAEAYVGLGACLIGMGKNAEALGPCEAAAGLNPRDPEAHCYWGVALRRLGQHADACTHYAEAVALRPRYDKAWCNWGVALERMGKLPEACGKYAKAIEIHPRNADAWFNWGVALARMRKHADACSKFERAVELRPRDPSALRYWATVLLKVGEEARARDALQRAAELEREAGGREQE